jgi:lysophospholipase L1-like esterase
MSVSGKHSTMRRVTQSLLLLCGSTVLMLLLAEVAVRIFMPQFLRPVFRERVEGVLYTRADLHGRVYSPGEFDTRANTTPQRFRGTTAYAPTPPPRTYRIAVIGDSYVFGTGAGDAETYPRHLESLLADLPGDRDVEVLNAGIHGSGTSDQALWYDRWVSSFRPHLVILTVFGGNDVCDELDDSKFHLTSDGSAVPLDPEKLKKQGGFRGILQSTVFKIPGYHFLTQHSHLLYAIRAMITAGVATLECDGGQDTTAGSGQVSPEATVEKMLAVMRWLQQRVAVTNARLVVVYIPSKEALLDQAPNSSAAIAERALYMRLLRDSTPAGIPLLDLTPRITAEMRADPGRLFFQRDPHMRPEGYRRVAEEVARFLAAGGYLDS